jgi:hypothetical protein
MCNGTMNLIGIMPTDKVFAGLIIGKYSIPSIPFVRKLIKFIDGLID